MISGLVSIAHGFMGPNTAVTACSTGNHCIGAAARSIAYGEADVMIAEAGVIPTLNSRFYFRKSAFYEF